MTYKDTILQAKNNIENYLYDFKGYFIRDGYDISSLTVKELSIIRKIDDTFDIIDEIVTFLLKDLKEKNDR